MHHPGPPALLLLCSVWAAALLLAGAGAAAAADANTRAPARYLATVQPCDCSAAGQAWTLRAAWGDSNTLINSQQPPAGSPHKSAPVACLDVPDWSSTPGTQIGSWQCCCTHIPGVCGECGQPEKNSNQQFFLNSTSNHLTTAPSLASLCLAASPAPTAGSAVATAVCAQADPATTAWVYATAAASPCMRLRLQSNTSLCLATGTSSPPPPPPAPPGGNPCADPTVSGLPFCNLSLPALARAQDLVSRLSLTEKAAQLQTVVPAVPRLRLPAYSYHSEGLHGVRDSCATLKIPATLFPQVTGMAATGNLSLIAAMGRVMGVEGRALNNIANGTIFAKGSGLDYWAPTLNIVRDPRWGRAQESISEDPFLNGAYSYTLVRAFQGDHPRYLQLAAGCKHLYGYSLEDSDGFSRHNFNAIISARDLAETYLPAFRACAAAGSAQVMCSYNAVNGIPTCADDHMQNTVLRGEWGFGGMVVSDCDAIADIYKSHKFVATGAEATAVGIAHGCDLDCNLGTPESVYSANAAAAVQQKLLNESALDAALARVLAMRFRLGMFDPPSLNPYRNASVYGRAAIDTPASRALALQAARESITLLKNSANLLPFNLDHKTNPAPTVAVVGPLANATAPLMGGKNDYCPPFFVSMLEGVAAYNITPLYAPPSASVEDVLRLAQQASLVVGVFGGVLGSEAHDRSNISLPADQMPLLEALAEHVASKFVLVLVNGEPVALDSVLPRLTTIVEAYEGGQSAGTAVADVLFGRYSPSGILPFTVYPDKYVTQVAMSDMAMRPNASSGSPGRTYRFYTGTPLFPFGFGLSYVDFALAWADPPPSRVSAAALAAGLRLAVRVSNKGHMSAAKVVQLYVAQAKQADAPLKSLAAMAKVTTQPGQSSTAYLDTGAIPTLCPFCTVAADGSAAIVPGSSFTVTVGDGGQGPSSTLLSFSLTVT